MSVNLGFLLLSTVKIVAVIAWIFGLLRVLGAKSKWVKILGMVAAFGIIQVLLMAEPGGRQLEQTIPPLATEKARCGPVAPQRAQSSNDGDRPAIARDLSR